ncbi:ribonuclease P protein component [Patescibacteria group bacterium]|nr:ribonuclease P protein component [Patescibacteria group bacterium]MCG2694809.1 ribonuclease P protein component [Candidatus Parcubacteria bacterium]
MLPKKQKVNKKLFDEVFKTGKSYHSDFLFLKLLKLEDPKEKSHFAVVVSKKISKKAVERNLIKRRIFAVLKENKDQIKTGFAVVFFVKKGTEKMSFEEYKKETINLLEKAKLI